MVGASASVMGTDTFNRRWTNQLLRQFNGPNPDPGHKHIMANKRKNKNMVSYVVHTPKRRYANPLGANYSAKPAPMSRPLPFSHYTRTAQERGSTDFTPVSAAYSTGHPARNTKTLVKRGSSAFIRTKHTFHTIEFEGGLTTTRSTRTGLIRLSPVLYNVPT